jgi:hypothetical protein
MSAKLTWFKFTPADWLSGKITMQSHHVQADFIRLCCRYWNKRCEFSLEDAESEYPETIKQLIKAKIIKTNGVFIGIEFLDEQMNEIAEASKKQSDRAKSRWKDKPTTDATAMPDDATAMPPHTSGIVAAMPDDAEKKRTEEKRTEKNNVADEKSKPMEKEIFTPENAFEKIHLAQTEHHQPSGTNIADYVTAYEAWRDRSLVDTLFQSTYTMKFNTTVPEIKRLLNDFHLHIIAIGKFHQTMSGWKRHFVSWLEIKRNAGEMKQIFKPNLSNGE